MTDEFQLFKAISTRQTKKHCFYRDNKEIDFKLTKTEFYSNFNKNNYKILTKITTLVTLGTTNTLISWFVLSFP